MTNGFTAENGSVFRAYIEGLAPGNFQARYVANDPINYDEIDIEEPLLREAKSLMVYPNPSEGKFTVQLDPTELENSSMAIYDMNGKNDFFKVYANSQRVI